MSLPAFCGPFYGSVCFCFICRFGGEIIPQGPEEAAHSSPGSEAIGRVMYFFSAMCKLVYAELAAVWCLQRSGGFLRLLSGRHGWLRFFRFFNHEIKALSIIINSLFHLVHCPRCSMFCGLMIGACWKG
jgi:hypothetical protein